MVQKYDSLAKKSLSSQRDSSQYLESITTPQKPHYLKPLSARSTRQSQNNGNFDLELVSTPEQTPQKSNFLCLPSPNLNCNLSKRREASIGSENVYRAFEEDLSVDSLSQQSFSSAQLPLRQVLRQRESKSAFKSKMDQLRDSIRQTITKGNEEVKDLLAIHSEKVRAEKLQKKQDHEESVMKDHETTSQNASVNSQRALKVIERSDEILQRDDAYTQVKTTLENIDKISQQKLQVLQDEEDRKKRALKAIQERKDRIEARRRVIGGGHLFRMNFAKDPTLLSPNNQHQKRSNINWSSRSLSARKQAGRREDEEEPVRENWMNLDEKKKKLYLQCRKELQARMALLNNINGQDDD